jgi:hypothetical protein
MTFRIAALIAFTCFAAAFVAGVVVDTPPGPRLMRSLGVMAAGWFCGALVGKSLEKLILRRLAKDWTEEEQTES